MVTMMATRQRQGDGRDPSNRSAAPRAPGEASGSDGPSAPSRRRPLISKAGWAFLAAMFAAAAIWAALIAMVVMIAGRHPI